MDHLQELMRGAQREAERAEELGITARPGLLAEARDVITKMYTDNMNRGPQVSRVKLQVTMQLRGSERSRKAWVVRDESGELSFGGALTTEKQAAVLTEPEEETIRSLFRVEREVRV